tara:strand:- start:91 stop:246 length:156 start_codon:yes stop_codon:yes gene_type:complete
MAINPFNKKPENKLGFIRKTPALACFCRLYATPLAIGTNQRESIISIIYKK